MSRADDFVSTLFPPPELDPLAEQLYGSKQALHRRHIKLLAERAIEPFKRLAQEKTGDCLIELQNWLAWEYQNRPTSVYASTLAPREEHPFQKIDQYNFPGMCVQTTFAFNVYNDSHTEGGVELEYNKRGVFNFLTCKNMTEAGDVDISVGDFVERAAKYAGIALPEPNYDVARLVIASVESNDDSFSIAITTYHHLGRLFHKSEETRHYLKALYTALLNIIYEETNTKEKRVTAIFLLSFLVGSNPLLVDGKGGAFQADFLLQHLLTSIGEHPVRKNFLGLTEIELLLLLAQDDSAAWEQPEKLYRAALEGDCNRLFHPVSVGLTPLIAMVSTDLTLTAKSNEANEHCHRSYACYRTTLRECLLHHQAPKLPPTSAHFFQSEQHRKAPSLTTPDLFFAKVLPFLEAKIEMTAKLDHYIQHCRIGNNDALLATMLKAEIDALTEHPENTDNVIAMIKDHFRTSTDTQYAVCIEKCAMLCGVDLVDHGQKFNAS